MKLNRNFPTKIDVFENLLPKIELMVLGASSQTDLNEPELRFMDFLESLSVNSEGANALMYKVDSWIIKVDKEKAIMEKRADGFLELYATDYNHYFSATKEYLIQSKKVLGLMKTIYTEFTNTGLREKYKYYDSEWKRKGHSLFDSSPLNSNCVQTSLYSLNTYPTPVQLLFAKVQTLFLKLEDLFNYALNVDNLVEKLRKDRGRIMEIFNKCRQKTEEDLKYIIEFLKLEKLEEEFPDMVNDLRTMNFEDFIVKYYHELNVAEFNYLMPLYRMVLKETYGINPEEGSLYDKVTDINRKIICVEKLRTFMQHLDEFDLKGIKVAGKEEHYVSSKFIAMLAEEVGIPYLKQKEFADYFTKHYQGIYVPVKYETVNKAYNRIDKNSQEYKDFKAKASQLTEKLQEAADLKNKTKVEVSDNHSAILASLLS